MIHALLAAFDALAWWQQLGIGVVALICLSLAVGTAYFMREIVGRSVDSESDFARAEADRIAAEQPQRVKPMNRQYTRDAFRAESRARLKQAQRGRS